MPKWATIWLLDNQMDIWRGHFFTVYLQSVQYCHLIVCTCMYGLYSMLYLHCKNKLDLARKKKHTRVSHCLGLCNLPLELSLKFTAHNGLIRDELHITWKAEEKRWQQQWADNELKSSLSEAPAAFSLHRKSPKDLDRVRSDSNLLKCFDRRSI